MKDKLFTGSGRRACSSLNNRKQEASQSSPTHRKPLRAGYGVIAQYDPR